MLQQHTIEKQIIVLSGIIYYLNPKNVDSLLLQRKAKAFFKVWNLKLLITCKKETSWQEDFAR